MSGSLCVCVCVCEDAIQNYAINCISLLWMDIKYSSNLIVAFIAFSSLVFSSLICLVLSSPVLSYREVYRHCRGPN
jgi:hypothetical protein